MVTKVEISHKTVFFVAAFLAALWFVAQVREILFLLFIAFLLMTALRPLVEFLERFRLPRVFAILLVYLVIFGFFGASFASAIPSLASQVNRLLAELPGITARVLPTLDIDVRSITQQIAPISENVVRVTVSIFSNVITLLTVLVFSFYFLMERRHAEGLLVSWMGEAGGSRVMEVLRAVELKLGAWARGQILLMFFIGLLVFIGLTLLHVDYALPLALLAGVLEIVPIIGPIISAVPAVVIGLATSPLLALSVVALYFIVQQVENNLVVPFVMKRSVGLSPLMTIVALMVGGKLAGFTGVFLAVPVLLVIQVLIGTFLAKQEKGH